MNIFINGKHKLAALFISLFVVGNVFAVKVADKLTEKANSIKRITELKLEEVYDAAGQLNLLLVTAIQENNSADNESKKSMLKLVGLKVLFGKIYKSIASFDYTRSKNADEIKSEILTSSLQDTGIRLVDGTYIFTGQDIIKEDELHVALEELWILMENVVRMTSELNDIKFVMQDNNCEAAFKTAKLIIYKDSAYSIAEFADLIERFKDEILELLKQTADKYINTAALEAAIADEKSKGTKPEKTGWGVTILNALKNGLTALAN